MNLLAVEMSHRSAPLDALERVAAACMDAGKVMQRLLDREHVAEVVLLSTCNRVEVYAVVTAFHDGLFDVIDTLADQAAMTRSGLTEHLHVHYGEAAVEHLFAVAAGLDSMVVGESQILGQLRTAYAEANRAGTVGRTLHQLCQQALRVGKRVHTETHIDAIGASVLSEALAAAATALAGPGRSGLSNRRVLVVGTGSLGRLAAAHLCRAGVAEIVLANRALDSAARLAGLCEAKGIPARVIGLDDVGAARAAVDLVICCTAATDAVLRAEHVNASCRPLVVCDLGLPRNVEPAVGVLPGVTLLGLSTLAGRQDQRIGSDAINSARQLIAAEVHRYLLTQPSAEVISTVAALRKWAGEVVDAEMLSLETRLPDLDPRARSEANRTVRRVVDKLLHAPTVRVQQFARADRGAAYTAALRELFELDPLTSGAISTPRGTFADT